MAKLKLRLTVDVGYDVEKLDDNLVFVLKEHLHELVADVYFEDRLGIPLKAVAEYAAHDVEVVES